MKLEHFDDEPIGRKSDEELRIIALEELHEDPEKKDDDIEAIRLWLEENNYTQRNDDNTILKFLRSCKFDLEKTKKRFEAYLNFRRDYPHWFSWRDPTSPEMDQTLNSSVYVQFDYNIPTGTRVSFFRIGRFNADLKFEDVVCLERMVLETTNLDDQSQILGCDLVADYTGFGLWHLKYYTPRFIMLYAKYMDTYPCRVKGLHLLHMPFIFRSLLTIGKLFLSQKLKDRIHIHPDVKSLHKFISPDSLPEEYEGNAGPLSKYLESTKQRVLKNKEYLRSISEIND